MTSTLGNTSNAGQLDTEDVGHINAFLVNAPVVGTINSISVYMGPIAAGAQFQVAIYSDLSGKPGSSVATSAVQALTANAWNTVPITYTFTAGQPLWLCYNASGTNPTLNNLTLSPGGSFSWQVAAFGSWPAFGTPEGSSSEMASIYATYTSSGTGVVPVAIDTFNGHTVYGDANQGDKVIPWQSFRLVASTAANWLATQCPLDPATNLPAYYSQAYLNPGTPPTVSDYWQYNPAGLLSMLIDSGTAWNCFSGNPALLNLAISLANYHLAHGLTPASNKWSSVPYSGATQGQASYDGLEKTDAGVEVVGVIEPDKIGEIGWQLANLFNTTGNIAYLNAAINNANALVANIRTSGSPWPFRAYALNGNVITDYSCDVIRPIQLFDALIALNAGNVASYQTTRTTVWNWLMSGPVTNNQWYNYFEDVPGGAANVNNYVPLETARYLLLNPTSDPNSLAKAQAIVAFVESQLGSTQWGASIMAEQQAYNFAMGSHTSRYGSVLALIAKATGDATVKDKAYRALSWATYEENVNGQVVAFIASGQPTQIWFSDGYGDYIRHFVSAMNTFPDWRK